MIGWNARVSVVLFVLSAGLWLHSIRLASSCKQNNAFAPVLMSSSPSPRSFSCDRLSPLRFPAKVERPDGTIAHVAKPPQFSLFSLAASAVGALRPAAGAQYFQDEAVFALAFANKNFTGRTFVEFGASDGFYNSNSLVFERAFGWKGLLLEPDPELANLALTIRTNPVLNELVCNQSSTNMNFAVFAQMGLSAILTDDQIDQLIKQRKSKGERAELLSKKALPCNLLSEILVREKWSSDKHIDFMSIDVEGMEYEIVKSFPWN